MGSWRDQILSEFTPQVARLTLVADPDGLLLEEGVLQGIQERGFELIPFDDHVAFRYAYESKYRSRWDRGELTDLVVVLRAASSTLGSLPYDLLQAGRKLSFNLGDLFPNLSYPVLDVLDRGDLDALFQAQAQHTPGTLGDNASKEFVLQHVFEIAPELVKQSSDLLRVLLRRHYCGQHVPGILDERFIQVLRQGGRFSDWPLERIIPDRAAFFGFLQERWPFFLQRVAAGCEVVHESAESYGLEFSGPVDIPFDHDDVRVYIDDLFLEGLLLPVAQEKGEALLGKWVGVGIATSREADRLRRVEGLLQSVEGSVPTAQARHQEWLAFAPKWAELTALRHDAGAALGPQIGERLLQIEGMFGEAFLGWVFCRFRSSGRRRVHRTADRPCSFD